MYNFNLPNKPKIKLKPRQPDNRQVVVMPLRALKDMELTNGSIRVLGIVCSYANRAGITWVSQARLAEDLGVTRSAITHHISALTFRICLEDLPTCLNWNPITSMATLLHPRITP